MQRNIYIENMPLEQARQIYIDRLKECGYFKMESEVIDVLESQGRITRSAVFARRSSPHYAAAAMDGIAVKASSTFDASEITPVTLPPGTFIEVDTGDYVPREFDAVIMIEDVNFIDSAARIIKAAVPWQHIRSVGEDLVAHDMVIPSSYQIGPYEVASLCTAAVPSVEVVKKPLVAIIPTGTELIDEGSDDMSPGEIVESNSRMLSGLSQEWGAVTYRHKIVPDDKNLLRQAVEEVKDKADMIIICSGSSAGREDYTSSIIEEFGEVLVHGIATRPGKPAILGVINNKPVIGVPGYPISAGLIFNLFARPVLYMKQGITPPQADILECNVSRKIASSMGVDEYIYTNIAKIDNHYIAYPLNRGAGITTSLVKADGAFCIKRGNEGLEAGEPCKVELNRPRNVIDNTIVMIGSHDMTVDFLVDILQRQYGIRLVSTNVGSMGGIMALRRAETHFSGIHLLDYETGDYNTSYLEKYLPGKNYILINLVIRKQGLIVKKGNPLEIESLQNVTREDVRFINRQKGAGTRILFDYLLSRDEISSVSINGYNREEYTHLAVAAAVKNDACDCGLGIYASARALDLDFIPIAEERYDLCILPDMLDKNRMEILLNTIKSSEFKNRVNAFGGYDLKLSGQVVYKNF
ncbi:MAG: molybdopterin biosynthesis protein [Syntrophomonadaceae bacterium]|nr:molybdopterin biosynthesis protein [Syntrophomonadaceae bacterium]MDD4548170.1 molybdopterin biosynthesis protein [Syntrophomonadaceae bacterium]